jgi:hypothetical protein
MTQRIVGNLLPTTSHMLFQEGQWHFQAPRAFLFRLFWMTRKGSRLLDFFLYTSHSSTQLFMMLALSVLLKNIKPNLELFFNKILNRSTLGPYVGKIEPKN